VERDSIFQNRDGILLYASRAELKLVGKIYKLDEIVISFEEGSFFKTKKASIS